MMFDVDVKLQHAPKIYIFDLTVRFGFWSEFRNLGEVVILKMSIMYNNKAAG